MNFDEIRDEKVHDSSDHEQLLEEQPITHDENITLQVLWKNKEYLIYPVWISLTGLLLGWDVGTIGGLTNLEAFRHTFGIPKIADGVEIYSINPWIVGLIVSGLHIGAAIGGLTLGRLSDTYGYRSSIIATLSIYLIGCIIQGCAVKIYNFWGVFMFGRFITGLTIGSLCVMGPLFTSECSPANLRGAAVSFGQNFCCLAILGGNLLLFIMNYYDQNSKNNEVLSWPLLSQVILCGCIAAGIYVTPESPRYLISIGNEEEARKTIAILKRKPRIDPEVDLEYHTLVSSIQATNDNQRNQQAGIKDLFKEKYLKRTVSAISVMAFQQLTGINYFFYYGTTLFASVGLKNPYITSIILGVVNLTSAPLGGFIIERFGRRKCLLFGSSIMFFCMLIYSSVGLYMEAMAPNSVSLGVLMIIFTCFHIVGFATTWGPCAGVVISEISNSQSLIMALANLFSWLMNFLISFFTPSITSTIGHGYGYFFTAFLLGSIFFVYYVLPETKGLNMEQIDRIYMPEHEEIDSSPQLEMITIEEVPNENKNSKQEEPLISINKDNFVDLGINDSTNN